MADLKNFSSSNDFNLHLSFHLVGDSTFGVQKKLLENLLYKNFGPTYQLEHEDPSEASEREVIYRLQKPIIDNKTSYKEFFEKLAVLFEESKRYLPSFTQGLENNS